MNRWAERYAQRQLRGECVRGSCKDKAIRGQTLCEYHRLKNLNQVKRNVDKKKRMTRTRERLPDDRKGYTQRFVISSRFEHDGQVEIQQIKGYFQTGEYEDGRLGEIFIRVGKPGESWAVLDQWAMMASVALQYGASIGETFGKALGTIFEPSGAVEGVAGVPRCTSVLDLIARAVIRRYDVPQLQQEASPQPVE